MPAPKITSCRKVRLNSGGYDSGGRYWGQGQTLYKLTVEHSVTAERCQLCRQGSAYGRCLSPLSFGGAHEMEALPVRLEEDTEYMRADSPNEAKTAVLRLYEGARHA